MNWNTIFWIPSLSFFPSNCPTMGISAATTPFNNVKKGLYKLPAIETPAK